MLEILKQSVFWGSFMSLAFYAFGMFLRSKKNAAIINPLLISILLTMLTLVGLKIPTETYNASAKYLSYLLTPATVCLAIPLYEQFELLKKNAVVILVGVLTSVLTSLCTILLMSVLFKLPHLQYVSLLPKSITTAIGMDVSEQLGGNVSVTVTAIIITGIFGNIIAEPVCKLFRITDPIARGVGIGSASHAIGTSKAMEIGPVEGAISGLSIAIAGILTVFTALLFSGLH